jgi:hypothetical protein
LRLSALQAIVAFPLFAFLFASGNQQQLPLPVSQIINKPSAYHGKQIMVRGFLLQEFENSALYSGQQWRRTKGIWVTPSAEMSKQRGKLNRHYVLLSGTFNANDHGHLGQFKGTLTVSAFELSPDGAPTPPAKQDPK